MRVAQEIITSRQNRLVIKVGKLADRKARMTEKCFRFDGIKLLREAVANGLSVEKLLLAESRAEQILAEISTLGDSPALRDAAVYILSDDAFSKVSGEQAPEGVVTVARFPSLHKRGGDASALIAAASAVPEKRILLLESVRDPGNVGTILRSAAAFGVDLVILSADCADIYNPKTIRGAMGALFRMEIAVAEDLTESIGALRKSGRRVFAAALDPTAVRLGKETFREGDAVVIGNEGHGLSAEAIRACGQSLYIPMEEGSESLNAAIAASVILWSMYSK